jgi:hypothetical protein
MTRGRERGGERGRIVGAAGAGTRSQREGGGGAGAESGRVEVVGVAVLFVGTVVVVV